MEQIIRSSPKIDERSFLLIVVCLQLLPLVLRLDGFSILLCKRAKTLTIEDGQFVGRHQLEARKNALDAKRRCELMQTGGLQTRNVACRDYQRSSPHHERRHVVAIGKNVEFADCRRLTCVCRRQLGAIHKTKRQLDDLRLHVFALDNAAALLLAIVFKHGAKNGRAGGKQKTRNLKMAAFINLSFMSQEYKSFY